MVGGMCGRGDVVGCMAGGCSWHGVCMAEGGMHRREGAMCGGCVWQGACIEGGQGVHGSWKAWQGSCKAGVVHGRGHAWQGACMTGGMCGPRNSNCNQW